MTNKIIDLFCGCGGLSKGFEMAGFDVALAIDFWEDAIATYNFNHSAQVGVCRDIHGLTNEELAEISKQDKIMGVIGGPPCQGFSTVGTRDINDPRNHLYLEYCRVVEAVDPTFFVIENVRGLTTLNSGGFKRDIIERFSALGYTVKHKILNAANFGVPQNRERVFFVGIKGIDFKFPDSEGEVITSKEAIGDLPALSDEDGDAETYSYITSPQNDYQKRMRGQRVNVYNHQITKHIQQTKDIIAMIPDGGSIKDLPEEYWNIRKYNKAFERMSSNRPSNTVDTGHRNYFHYNLNRVPTVRENCRLQSFDDDFIVLGSKTSQYKQIGNAVPPLLSYAIAKSIMDQLKENEMLCG